jgi:lysophospholipase L1-like esterase
VSVEKKTVVIIGHSFVVGLDQHFRDRYRGPEGKYPCFLANQLKVDHNIKAICMLGQSGAKAVGFDTPAYTLGKIKPDIILIDLGTNDLAQAIPVETVRDKLVSLADDLQNTHNAVVGIMSILPREKGIHTSALEFKAKAGLCNLSLKIAIRNLKPIFFFSHKGFWERQILMGSQTFKVERQVEEWSKDGIHPNSQEGRKNYKNSIRTAICQALRLLKSI